MEMEMGICSQISANGILVWFVFGLIFGLGFNLTMWPFRRWG